jgi:hypothetical protein
MMTMRGRIRLSIRRTSFLSISAENSGEYERYVSMTVACLPGGSDSSSQGCGFELVMSTVDSHGGLGFRICGRDIITEKWFNDGFDVSNYVVGLISRKQVGD